MPPPCGHQEGEHLPATNRLCFLWLHDEGYNRLWGGDGNVTPGVWLAKPHAAPADRTKCLFHGEAVGLRDCESCNGRVRLKTFACLSPDAGGEVTVQDCNRCPFFKEQADGR